MLEAGGARSQPELCRPPSLSYLETPHGAGLEPEEGRVFRQRLSPCFPESTWVVPALLPSLLVAGEGSLWNCPPPGLLLEGLSG